jgi:hypothetical protein
VRDGTRGVLSEEQLGRLARYFDEEVTFSRLIEYHLYERSTTPHGLQTDHPLGYAAYGNTYYYPRRGTWAAG